ncbi:chloride channel protein [Oleiagrimonas soli]|uniref:H+/Cl- antiporter ClcA n=1 Tax=Oleiagrimonas soli TaxID=1543381 RepID=A0A841KC97_9GAMM|nr:chloride channel protein [Oleiagrimonas soli]MBB6182802.1 H+/Cl- antiporter ClcA [Oleiagrimonas soli]
MPDAAAPRKSTNPRLEALLGHEFFAPHHWKRRIALWLGAILVALAAIVFAKASDWSFSLFQRMVAYKAWLPLCVTPVVFGLLAWATEGKLRAARGSGIPQVIGTLHVEDAGFRERMLALPIAISKMVMTLLAMMVGASIGREGPTVHVGAGLFHSLGRRFGYTDPKAASRFILAGGAAGIAAAFNAPLAGVVFAIEELAGAFEHRFSGLLLTSVIVGGVVSLGVLGNYSYFGAVDVDLPFGNAWLAVLATGIVGGLLGGLFARLVLLSRRGPLAYIGRVRARWPVLFAVGCGLALGLLGLMSHNSVYGTGYDQARAFVQNAPDTAGAWFGINKLFANVVSYWAGIPGGLFSPALAVGAGLGHNIAHFLPHVPVAAVVLLGMSSYLSGVTGAPLTSAVISMELTDNQSMIIPIMAACLLARAAASLFSPTPVYKDFAERLVRDFEDRQKQLREAEEQAEQERQREHFAGIDTDDAKPAQPEATNRTTAFEEVSAEPANKDEAAADGEQTEAQATSAASPPDTGAPPDDGERR